MKRFCALLLCTMLFVAGCSTREPDESLPQQPFVPVQVGPVESVGGVYQGELLLQPQRFPLQMRTAQRPELEKAAEYQDFSQLGSAAASQQLSLCFSAAGSLDFLAVIELDDNGGDEMYLGHFRIDPTRREAFATLKDFAPGQVLYKLRYHADGGTERSAYLHKDEDGQLYLSHNRQGPDDGYIDPGDAQVLAGELARYGTEPVLQNGGYEIRCEPGSLTINNGNGYTLRHYDLNQLFDVSNPGEVWGDVFAMLQGDRLTFLVQYRNEDEGQYSQQGRAKSAYGVRNFAASFDLSTGNCLAVEKLKRGDIAFWETDSDMLYFCHTDVDRDTNLYKWDVASFSSSAFVYVNTAAGSYEQDELLRLTGMELQKDGSIQLSGLDAYTYDQQVTLAVDLKKGSYQRSPQPAGVDKTQSHRPLLVNGTYQIGDMGVGAGYSTRYSFQHDGTFLWFASDMGYTSPEAVSPVTAKGGGWRIEGDELVLVTMTIAEVTNGVLQEPGGSTGWHLAGETQLRLLNPGDYITERVPFSIWDPDGVYIGIDGQLYTHVLWDFTTTLQKLYENGGNREELHSYAMDIESYYDVWQQLAGLELG